MRKPFDNLIGCIARVYDSHGRLWDQRLKESGLRLDVFVMSEEEQAIREELERIRYTRAIVPPRAELAGMPSEPGRVARSAVTSDQS